MAFVPQRALDMSWVFGDKIQTNYATILGAVDLTRRIAFENADFPAITKQVETDRAKFGKGHGFTTSFLEVGRDVRLARSFDCSTLSAGALLQLLFGAVSTSGLGPYDHVFTFADPLVDINAPTTTFYIEEGSGVLRRLHSMACNDVAFSGRNLQAVKMSGNLIGSGEVTSGTIALPAITVPTILRAGDVSALLGTQGAPTDLSERVLEWSFNISSNLREATGRYPGTGIYRGRMWYGTPTVTAEIKMFRKDNADLIDLFMSSTIQELQINMAGDANNHLNVIFPALRFFEHSTVVEDEMIVDVLSTGPDGVFLDSGGTPNEPIEVTLRNDVPAYLVAA